MDERRREPSSPALRAPWVLVAAALLSGCETVVVSVIEVSDVEVVPPSLTMIAGDRQTASAVVTETGGTKLSGLAVTWTIDDAGVAMVSPEGIVEGRAPGTTVVRASAEGVSGAAAVTVLRGPTIRLSTRSLELEASSLQSAITREVEVENAGNGTLAALAVAVTDRGGASVGWLAAELLTTTAPTRLRLVVDPRDLAAGVYEASVIVHSPAALSGSADVRVRLNVLAAPDPPGPEPEPEPQPGPGCDATDHTFEDDVEIPRNASCTFTNVRVLGRVRVREGARLVASQLTVDENLEADGAAELTLSDSEIRGDVKVEKSASATTSNSSIGGKLELEDNRGPITLTDNIVREAIKLEDNRVGPFTLLRNTSRSLECKENDPSPTGGGNVVSGRKSGQCAGL